MRRSSAERGEGKIGCAFWILVVLVIGIVGVKVIPIKMNVMPSCFLAAFGSLRTSAKIQSAWSA